MFSKKTWLVLLGVVVVLIVSQAAFPSQTASAQGTSWGFMMGNVYDTAGKPIEKALVTASGNGFLQTKKTNAYGAWSFGVLQQGYYTVTISKPKYAPQTLTVFAGSSAYPNQTFLALTKPR